MSDPAASPRKRGALPKIDCGTGNGVYSCVLLLDQSGCMIRDLEVTGTKVDSTNEPHGQV